MERKNMETIEIIPLSGIKINEKTIPLSATRQEVESLLGTPYAEHSHSCYYFHNELRFDFDENSTVKYIEFLAGIDGQLQPQIYGVPAFQAEADKVFELLSAKNNGEIDDREHGYAYVFLNISVGIFSPSTPESVEDMIEDAEEDGEPMDEDDIAYERRKASHWATIGIGVAGYYTGVM